MYKGKLQEMCQRERWALPNYVYMKDGPDHDPRFKASVSVNGITFHSSPSCRNSKEAQNDAAKFAFIHFSSPPILGGSSTESTEASASGGPDNQSSALDEGNVSPGSGAELNTEGPKNGSGTSQISAYTQSQPLAVIDDIHGQYKVLLENYAKWKNLESPVLYSIESEGPPHNFIFKATVTVDGQIFESPDFFKTVKEAENAAAKAAIMSLSLDVAPVVELGFYKNLLAELTQRENLSRPVFKTTQSGASHMPTFVSSVEVEGEIFHGKAGTSKKEAEANAALVAYTTLKENQAQGKSEATARTKGKAIAEESSPPTAELPDLSALSLSDSNKGKATSATSSLLGNRVRVYPRYPEMALPEGVTVLPISDDKWVAVRLEFPDDQVD